MLTTLAYISAILGIIASIIEILQFFKVLSVKNKLILFIIVAFTTTICFFIYYKIDNNRQAEEIKKVKENLLKKDAKTTADAIIITGWEDSGDYIGYLTQITGFYARHKEVYSVEFETYNRQLKSWVTFFEKNRENSQFYQGYSSELSELKGLVNAGKDNIEKIYEMEIKQ